MKKVISLLLIGLVASLAVVVVSPAGAKKGHPKGTAAAKRHAVGGVVQAVGYRFGHAHPQEGQPGDRSGRRRHEDRRQREVRHALRRQGRIRRPGEAGQGGCAGEAAPRSRRSGARHHRRRAGRLGRRQLDHAEEAGRQLRGHPGRREHEDPGQREGRHARGRRDRLPRVRPAYRRGRPGSRDPGLREEGRAGTSCSSAASSTPSGRTRSRSRDTAGARRRST